MPSTGSSAATPCWASRIAVVYKFFDDQGVYLAALITYYGFLSLFPLLLLLASVLGFVLRDDPDLQQRILDSTISQFPVIGDQLRGPQGLQGSGVALVVGALVAIYGALGVGQALQNALNIAWAVPRNDRPNPIKARVRSLLIVVDGWPRRARHDDGVGAGGCARRAGWRVERRGRRSWSRSPPCSPTR